MSNNNSGFSKTIGQAITSTNTGKQTTPDFSVPNPLDKDIFINAIQIIPDPSFSANGILQINLNGAPIFQPNAAAFFTQYLSYSVPLPSRTLLNSYSLDFFIWNGIDSSPVSCSISVTISESSNDLSAPNEASQISLYSPSIVVFPFQLRNTGVYYQNIDLSGHEKIILMISAAGYITPVSDFWFSVPAGVSLGNASNLIDGSLATYADLNTDGLGYGGHATWGLQIDWGSIASRILAYSYNTQGLLAGHSYANYITTVQVSTDAITWVPQSVGNPQTFRYAQFTFTCNMPAGPPPPYMSINEVYDSQTFGGTASVSFEAFEPSSGQWIEIISAATLGTISQGQSVARQIGNTMVSTNFNQILPTNFSALRLKLTITGSSIKNSVSILKVV